MLPKSEARQTAHLSGARDTHGKEILECVSEPFLDLATALRLETINARDLVSLLAKAGRLGYRDTNIIEDRVVIL
jgi:hypothetical protein